MLPKTHHTPKYEDLFSVDFPNQLLSDIYYNLSIIMYVCFSNAQGMREQLSILHSPFSGLFGNYFIARQAGMRDL